jgi:hypothetical protein
MSTQRKPDALQHVEHTFVLNGLDPAPLADLDQSCAGRAARSISRRSNDRRQIIAIRSC